MSVNDEHKAAFTWQPRHLCVCVIKKKKHHVNVTQCNLKSFHCFIRYKHVQFSKKTKERLCVLIHLFVWLPSYDRLWLKQRAIIASPRKQIPVLQEKEEREYEKKKLSRN